MIDIEKETLAAELRGSLLSFTQYFYKLLTGRDFIISNPLGRESHHIIICRALTQLFRLEIPSQRLNINIEPGSGKSTLLAFWTAWCFAHYPDCRFLFISYSKVLATKHTETIKRIIQLPHYKYLFDVSIRHDSKAKEFFQTTQGGAVAAFGTGGAVTGQDGGLPGENRFTGAVILDDAHKPDEANSDTMRQSVINNYDETIRQRPRGINVPIVHVGQRVHEDDLINFFLSGNDVDTWDSFILKSLDDAGNALYPEKMPRERLIRMQEKSPYVFASQYQQDPLPAGGGLFKPEWFVLLDEDPDIFMTFITVDTAESEKQWADATAFSLFGLYEIETLGRKTGDLGLHWIDCEELRIEPKDLKDSFLDFWQRCMRYKVAPMISAVEKKSTGVTLLSTLSDLRGMKIREIERSRASGSKTQRFIDCQTSIAEKRISLPSYAKHTKQCIEHMSKITANDTHRHDDLADTLADAIKIALIDKTLNFTINSTKNNDLAAKVVQNNRKIRAIKRNLYGGQ